MGIFNSSWSTGNSDLYRHSSDGDDPCYQKYEVIISCSMHQRFWGMAISKSRKCQCYKCPAKGDLKPDCKPKTKRYGLHGQEHFQIRKLCCPEECSPCVPPGEVHSGPQGGPFYAECPCCKRDSFNKFYTNCPPSETSDGPDWEKCGIGPELGQVCEFVGCAWEQATGGDQHRSAEYVAEVQMNNNDLPPIDCKESCIIETPTGGF